MHALLIAALLARTSLSLTVPTPTTPTLSPRQTNVYADMEIHTHPLPNCAGPGQGFKAVYGQKMPLQVSSYHLSRDLKPGEALDYWNALPAGGPVDTAFNLDPVACKVKIADASGKGLKAGCTTLRAPVGCLRVWQP